MFNKKLKEKIESLEYNLKVAENNRDRYIQGFEQLKEQVWKLLPEITDDTNVLGHQYLYTTSAVEMLYTKKKAEREEREFKEKVLKIVREADEKV